MDSIIIRKPKASDAEGLIEMWNEGLKRKFYVYNGGNTLATKKDIIKAKKNYSITRSHDCTFIAIDKVNNKFVGKCSFFGKEKGRTRHRVDLGWIVHPDYAGMGIATKLVQAVLREAKKRGFKRAEAEAATKNIASVKLAKRAGFKIEGKRKAGLLLDNGKYVDTYLFGKILK